MKSLIKLLSLLLLAGLLSVACSPESAVSESTPPEIITPPIVPVPADSKLKPAIRNMSLSSNTKKTSSTSKTAEVRKHVSKSINFANTTVSIIYKYRLNNMTLEQYKALPTDNIYDVKEDSLNISTEHQSECTYIYNTLNQLTEIKTQILLPINVAGQAPSETFTYDSAGNINATSKDIYNRAYEYNLNGLISSKKNSSGKVEFSYEYDGQGRIVTVLHYSNDAIDAEISYSYPDATLYWKTIYVVNSLDGTKDKIDSLLYQYDPSKPGIYNKEPIYRLNNEYLHIIEITDYPKYNGYKASWSVRPKYFYNAEGYLMKYDAAGLNNTVDIITYKYE